MVPHGAPSGRSGDLLIEHFDREHHTVSGPQEIVDTLVQAGPASHGVVFQHRSQGEGHVFNALYDERLNSVVFIDAQNGRLGSFDPNDRYGFMLVTGDDPHAPVPMDVDTTFGGPKADSVSHDSFTKSNVGHGFGDDIGGRHRLSAEGNSHDRRFEHDDDSELPEPPRRSEDSPANATVEAAPLPFGGPATTSPLHPQSGPQPAQSLPGASLPPPGQRRSSLNLNSSADPAGFLELSSSTDARERLS
jgi:Papain fold toxin 1, glutamine deamidase